MSDDSQGERRSSRRGSFTDVRDGSAPSSQRLPNLDEVFLDDEELEPGEEDTESVAAVDALGPGGDFDLDDETVVSDPNAFEPPPAPPSSARLSAPPGAIITVRPRISAPPMAVPQVRPPISAPPPFVAGRAEGSDAFDLDSHVGATEPDDEVIDEPDEIIDEPDEIIDEPDELGNHASTPDSSEIVEADMYSAPAEDLRPATQPAEMLRASFSPRERSADPALSALFSAKSRPSARPAASSVRPPPPSLRPAPASAPPLLGTPPPPPPLTPPPPDRYQVPKTLVSAPSVAPEPEPWSPPPKRSRRAPMVLLLVGLLAVVGGGFWLLEQSEPGSLMLTASSSGSAPVSGLELYLDGDLVCRASPCDIAQLSQGTHFVRAKADGFPATADQAVVVRAREQSQHDIVLERPAANARITIVTHVPGFVVSVDGTERGLSPIELTDLTVGKHTLRVEKDGFEPEQQEIVVQRDQERTIGPIQPPLLVGQLEVSALPGSEDAEVRLDGELVALPLTKQLDARQKHRLSAEKPGLPKFEQTVSFDGDNQVVRVRIDLGTNTAPPSAAPAPKSPHGREPPTSAPAAASKATLNFNSIPSSTVVLDGRPLGQTPVMGVSVSPGSHNVLFVHPERGRKAVHVAVDAGVKRTVSVRF